MLKLIIPVAGLASLLAVGVLWLFFPDRYVRWLLKGDRESFLGRLNPYRPFYQPDAFRPTLRLGGLVSLGLFAVLLWLLVTSYGR